MLLPLVVAKSDVTSLWPVKYVRVKGSGKGESVTVFGGATGQEVQTTPAGKEQERVEAAERARVEAVQTARTNMEVMEVDAYLEEQKRLVDTEHLVLNCFAGLQVLVVILATLVLASWALGARTSANGAGSVPAGGPTVPSASLVGGEGSVMAVAGVSLATVSRLAGLAAARDQGSRPQGNGGRWHRIRRLPRVQSAGGERRAGHKRLQVRDSTGMGVWRGVDASHHLVQARSARRG